MKDPVLGSNKKQSFIDFETTKGKVRWGIEGPEQTQFIEVGETKIYLIDENGYHKVGGLTELTSGVGISVDGVLKARTPLFHAAVATVTVEEFGDGTDVVTKLTLTNFVIGHIPAAAAAISVGAAIGHFPSGGIHIEDVFYQSLSLTCLGTAVNADLGLGSLVVTGGANATLQAEGATCEDRLTGQTVPTAIGGGAVTAATVRAAAGGSAVNIATSVKDVFLNAAGTWNVNNHGDLTVSGTIVIKWTKIT